MAVDMGALTPPRRTVRAGAYGSGGMGGLGAEGVLVASPSASSFPSNNNVNAAQGSPVLRPMSMATATTALALSPNEAGADTPPAVASPMGAGLRYRDTNAGYGGVSLGVMSSPTKLARSPHAARGLGLAAANVSIVEYLKSPERFPHGPNNDLALLRGPPHGQRDKENLQIPSSDTPSKSGLFSPRPAALAAAAGSKQAGAAPAAASIPRFYFPGGNPDVVNDERERRRLVLMRTKPLFGDGIGVEGFDAVAAMCDLTRFMSRPLFAAIDTQGRGVVTHTQFSRFWKQLSEANLDVPSCAFALLAKNGVIMPKDLVVLIRDIADRHPSLSLLKDTAVFKDKYVESVIIRIFYSLDRGRTGKIQLRQFRESNFMATLKAVDGTNDINLVLDYFSYKHFYVLYCRFWELDTDHDGVISKRELQNHEQHALSLRIIDQVVQGAGRLDHASVPLGGGPSLAERAAKRQMIFEDFVWFLLSEEDKTTLTAQEYWFRCLDMDADGVLSLFELEYYYEEMQKRLGMVAVETLALHDTLCQILDFVNPGGALAITLADLRRCKLAPQFFDTLFNMAKFVTRETKHPSMIREERNRPKMTDWARFAEEEYNHMAIEHAAEDEVDESEGISDMEPDADISLMEISEQLPSSPPHGAADDTPALRRNL